MRSDIALTILGSHSYTDRQKAKESKRDRERGREMRTWMYAKYKYLLINSGQNDKRQLTKSKIDHIYWHVHTTYV